MDVTNIINLSSAVAYLIITTFLLVGTVVASDFKLSLNRWFFLTVLLSVLLVICDFTVAFCEGHTEPFFGALARVGDCFSYSFHGFSLFTFGMYYYELLNVKTKINSNIRILFGALSAISVFLAIIAAFFGWYARFDEYNHYYTQDMFWISAICPIVAAATLSFLVVKNKKVLKAGEFLSLVAYPLILIVAYTIEVLRPGLWVSNIGAAIAFMLLYANIQIEVRHQAAIKEKELTKARISVMLSQIQPHFLYNSLNAIDNLYFQNLDEAHKAMLDFSDYLRGNMDSLSQKELIPFSKELEHTRQYLRLERLRFADKLQITYDIKKENFKLPTLTLQPIVENAVRYGITKKRGGSSIIIRTEETETSFRITVIDDGAGFDQSLLKKDGRSHTGISNVRNRLAAMCQGTLIIESEAHKGTTAIIEIPKRGKG